jgi:hypothetical protein
MCCIHFMRIFAGAVQPALAAIVALMTAGASGQPAVPAGLLVNGAVNPLAIRARGDPLCLAVGGRQPGGSPNRLSNTGFLQSRTTGRGNGRLVGPRQSGI